MYAYIHNNMIYYSNDFVKKKKKNKLVGYIYNTR